MFVAYGRAPSLSRGYSDGGSRRYMDRAARDIGGSCLKLTACGVRAYTCLHVHLSKIRIKQPFLTSIHHRSGSSASRTVRKTETSALLKDSCCSAQSGIIDSMEACRGTDNISRRLSMASDTQKRTAYTLRAHVTACHVKLNCSFYLRWVLDVEFLMCLSY